MQQDKANQGSVNKTAFIIIGVIAVVAVLYFAFRSGDSLENGDPNILVQVPAAVDDVGNEVRGLLAQLNNLNIDTKFFESGAYKSLVDNTTPIPSQNIGRYKPFEPFDPKNYKAAPSSSSSQPPK